MDNLYSHRTEIPSPLIYLVVISGKSREHVMPADVWPARLVARPPLVVDLLSRRKAASVHDLVSTLPVRLRVEELWAGLRHKAENPVGYIPAITACTVLERTESGFVREIVIRDTVRQRERVTFQPMRKIVFDQLTDPDLATIVNEITEDDNGISLTLIVVVSANGMARAQREPTFLADTEEYFAGTLRTIVAELHRGATDEGMKIS